MAKKRILVVDDERPILELLKFKLSRRRFEVATANDEKEFWEKAFEQKPTLIILDIGLKNKIGTDIYHNLLNFGFDPNVPVIFMTALVKDQPSHSETPGRKYALYSKPFDFDLLIKKIDELIDTRETKKGSIATG